MRKRLSAFIEKIAPNIKYLFLKTSKNKFKFFKIDTPIDLQIDKYSRFQEEETDLLFKNGGNVAVLWKVSKLNESADKSDIVNIIICICCNIAGDSINAFDQAKCKTFLSNADLKSFLILNNCQAIHYLDWPSSVEDFKSKEQQILSAY